MAELFKLLEGLQPVDPAALAAFEQEMTSHAIPEIMRAVKRRQLLAEEARQRKMELSTGLLNGGRE